MVSVKPKKKRMWLRLFTAFLFFGVTAAWYSVALNDMRQSDHEVTEFFSEFNRPKTIDYIPYAEDSIRIIQTGLPSTEAEMTIVFVHGAPGSSDAFYSYLNDFFLVDKAHLVSYDRPGYGYSDYANPMTSIKNQADVIMAILDHLNSKKVILVSHSYGCAIAGVFTANNPSMVSANVMICPVIDPEEEKVFFFSSWPSLPVIKHLFSGAMQVSSFEKMTHAEELKIIEPLWQKTTVPTILMHGEKDWIAPVENAYYLNDKITDQYLRVEVDEAESHFILWTQQAQVVQTILKFI